MIKPTKYLKITYEFEPYPLYGYDKVKTDSVLVLDKKDGLRVLKKGSNNYNAKLKCVIKEVSCEEVELFGTLVNEVRTFNRKLSLGACERDTIGEEEDDGERWW